MSCKGNTPACKAKRKAAKAASKDDRMGIPVNRVNVQRTYVEPLSKGYREMYKGVVDELWDPYWEPMPYLRPMNEQERTLYNAGIETIKYSSVMTRRE